MNIHQRRTLQWMTAVMALMAGAWFLLSIQKETKDRLYIFPELENADIARVRLTYAEGSLTVLRSDDGWRRMSQDGLEVDYALFEPMLKNLLQASQSPALANKNAAQYGLEPPRMTITVIEHDGASHLLKIGNALQVSTDTYISRGTNIHTTPGNLPLEWQATIDTILSIPKSDTDEKAGQSPVATP